MNQDRFTIIKWITFLKNRIPLGETLFEKELSRNIVYKTVYHREKTCLGQRIKIRVWSIRIRQKDWSHFLPFFPSRHGGRAMAEK